MTQNEFFTEYNDLIRGLVYKACKDPDMRDDVYSEVVMSLLSSGTVFDLPKPAQIAYIKKAAETTSYCKKKSLKKSKTYGDMQSDDNDTEPEEYAIPDDRYAPETERQDLIGRDKALDLAEQWKTTKKLIITLQKKAKIRMDCIKGSRGIGMYSSMNTRHILTNYQQGCIWATKRRIRDLARTEQKKEKK